MVQDYEQVKSVIKTIKIIANAMKVKQIGFEDIQNVQITVAEINQMLYHTAKLKFQRDYNLNLEGDYFSYAGELEALAVLWEESLKHYEENSVDREFWGIYEYFKYVDPDTIYQTIVEVFKALPEGLRIEFLSLPHRYTFLTSKIDYTKEDFSLIRQHVNLMVKEVEKYRWLYEHLSDYRSKKVLNGVIRYWFEFDLNKLHALTETVFFDYYDLDILQCDQNDVMVDIGAYTGDSVLDFIYTYGEYNKIYAYEITPSTYQALQQNVSGYPNVTLVNKGVGNHNGKMYVSGIAYGAGNKISEQGETEVEVVTLDEDIKEPVTVIKMDIEGAEKDALLGAKRHIVEEKPKLLISSYHLPEDIFEIPYLIHSIREDYKFYMRFNGHNGIWPCDYVLFAV